MSETRTKRADEEKATNGDQEDMERHSVLGDPRQPASLASSIGVYDRPARRIAHRGLNLILLLVIILLLAFLAYQRWF